MVGARIKKYLDDNGIKQKYLVDKTGLTSSIVSDICIHDRKIEVTEYHKICQALGLPLDYFLKESDE